MWKTLLFVLAIVFFNAGHVSATIFFQSQEESYLPDLPLPSPLYIPESGFSPRQDKGYTRAVTGNPKGAKVLEWKTDVPNATDMFNALTYGTTPPNGGTIYMAAFIKAVRVNGVQIWPDAVLAAEGVDKAIELVGPNYRWTLLWGVRNHVGPTGKWNIWITNPAPGHFNPQCEVNANYYNNFSGYGRGFSEANVCQPTMGDPFYPLDYDRWYAIVFKVSFDGGNNGEIGLWINGTKVSQYTNIITCGVPASSCAHDRPQVWGTYNQPSYNGPAHKRQVDAFVVTDDFSYLQANGYFRDPQNTSTSPPSPPVNLRVQ